MLNNVTRDFADTLSSAGLDVRRADTTYLEEPRGLYHGRDSFVARPRNVDEVSQIVRACSDAEMGIVPYGGGTGLVSGQISTEGPVPLILSMERMSAVRDVFPSESALIAEAGASVAEVQKAADGIGMLFPLAYASQESARIGGALSVNSGGLNVLRYGMARDLCLGVEAVLPDGQILRGLKRLRKDNTGYDLRHLLIGSEGTLGIITAAALALSPRPAHVATAFLAVPSPEAALELLRLFRDAAGETISAFEIISREAFLFLDEAHVPVRSPFDEAPDWAVLTEIATGPGSDPEAMLLSAFEQAMERGLVLDGAIAQSGQQQAEFWAVRESIPAANRRIGAIASHDISLPLSALPEFLRVAEEALLAKSDVRINAFGHLGDGNLHYNLFPPKGASRDSYREQAAELSRVIYDRVAEYDGSFSAEHGLGRIKVGALERYGDPAKLSAMRAIKAAIDPKGIMNPGAVLRG